MLVFISMLLHLAAASSSVQEQLDGEPLSAGISNIRGAFQTEHVSSLSSDSTSSLRPRLRPTIGLLESAVTGYYTYGRYTDAAMFLNLVPHSL